MKVKNITNTKGNKIKNQFIIKTNDSLVFQSYDSVIVEIRNCYHENKKIFLDEKYWNYSTTTSKYRNIFLEESTEETQKKIDSGEYILTNLN